MRRLLAEQVEDTKDSRILVGLDVGDLCTETLKTYRQVFANRDPAHPWNDAEDREFLRQIGAWRRNRETGEQGITLAGLLMFGHMSSIQDELPFYMLDYQERPEPSADARWIDRITLDGKWSGNLYDFFRKVYLKLTADLKVPFKLEHGERKDETPVHEALREALANTLVHADYSDRASVLVVKRPDLFGFRNPGLMRVPIEIAISGGEHDCRNRILHKIFRLVGVGEQAGTGIPKILHGWHSRHWIAPKLFEVTAPNPQTRLELQMIDIMPKHVTERLRTLFGQRFDGLSPEEKTALALAATEGTLNHARLRTCTGIHPGDVSKVLQGLCQLEMLKSTGGRGAIYSLPGEEIPTPEDVFGPKGPILSTPSVPVELSYTQKSGPNQAIIHNQLSSNSYTHSSPNLNLSSPNLAASSPNLTASSPNLDLSSPNLDLSCTNTEKEQALPLSDRDSKGRLISTQLKHPVIDDLSRLTPAFRTELEAIAANPREKRRLEQELMVSVILSLCTEQYITMRALAELVDRQPETLRGQYLTKLVKERSLVLAFPTNPTHEKQAYRTTRPA